MTTKPARRPVTRATLAILLLVIGTGVLGRAYRLGDPMTGYRPHDTAAIARNFHDNGMHILYPQIDWRGSSTGYVESEFPLYTYAVAALYQVFGVHEVIGSAVSILEYAISALLLFALVRRLYDDTAGLLATLFYSIATVVWYYTRSFQPDALLALGSLAGLYYFWVWSEEGGLPALALSAAGVAVATLIKPTNLYLGLPLLYLAYRAFGIRCFRRLELWLFAIVVTVPAALWYRHAFQFWITDGNTFGVFGGWVKFKAFPPDLYLTLAAAKAIVSRLFVLVATPLGCVLLLVGFLRRPPQRNYLLHWWCAGFAVVVVVAAKGVEAHDYYELPAVFFVAAWMAYGVVALWNAEVRPRRLLRPALVVACLSVVAFSLWRWKIRLDRVTPELNRVAFAQRVAEVTEPSALIVMVRPYRGVPGLYQHRLSAGVYLECDPVDFYRSHRIGWSLDDRLARLPLIETLRGRGARYLATAFPEVLANNAALKAELDSRYTPVDVNPRWAIYRLDQPATKTAP
jgi:hypothetical protein